jgi:hypothetical protein
LKKFISILHSSVFQHRYYRRYKFPSINTINTINMSFNNTRRNGGVRYSRSSTTTANPFCKVCHDAGLPTEEFTSHFVKDQPGPNGRVVCPTLLAQKCLICGIPGHTSSYCPDNSSVSSSSTVQKETRYALATDDIRPPHSVRLPPIQKQQQQQQQQQPLYRPAPRIVYANELPSKNPVDARREFPSLPNLSSLRRFENDEPPLKRESAAAAAAASPVHSPVASRTKVKYNKKNNPFGVLDDNVDSGREEAPLPVVQKQENVSSSSSWASIAACGKSTIVASSSSSSKQPQQRARSRFSIIVPTAISAAPLPLPPSFKPKSVSASDLEKKKQVKKLWGDTDSEDDDEFLKRGLAEQQ